MEKHNTVEKIETSYQDVMNILQNKDNNDKTKKNSIDIASIDDTSKSNSSYSELFNQHRYYIEVITLFASSDNITDIQFTKQTIVAFLSFLEEHVVIKEAIPYEFILLNLYEKLSERQIQLQNSINKVKTL